MMSGGAPARKRCASTRPAAQVPPSSTQASGISSALADIRRAGVRVIGADMDGAPPWEIDLTGPIAFVLGGEDKGLTDPVRKRCDAIAGIPLAGGLQSLNVSVTAGVLLFERVRQMAERAKKGGG